MNYHKLYIALLTLLFGLAGGIVPAAGAENHALLIGIGEYRQRTLQGPPFDVAALAKMLSTHYGFPGENIRTLVNQQAVKSKILHEFELLTQRTRPGDRVFIYYSGHGTSRRDEVMALPLPHATGALVPADFNGSAGQSAEQLLAQLIIGKRDLRPTLQRLDRDREILMVFDTCFSGNTVRAAAAVGPADSSRYLRLSARSVFDAERDIGPFEENLKSEDPYPYHNIFYISASTENEVAKDIRRDTLHLYPTIDGKPHGVLTDSLLRVLAGQRPVDTNRDGQWSQFELYTAVRGDVKRRFKQTPQALPRVGPQADRLNARPFFVRSAAGAEAAFPLPKDPSPGRHVQVQDYRPDYSFSHALVVGIDKYQRWPRLEYAVKDAREMAVLLESHGFQIHLLTDERATLRNILAELKTIGQAADENSRVVFYFAGHGQTEDLPGGRERGYIVPVDADDYDWHRTMLPMDELNRSFKRFKAKHILMAFDSCYSGLGLTRSIKRDSAQNSAYIQKMMRSRSIQILTAGSRSEQAIEAAGHGLFTDHLLAALAGAADINADGYITATEIYATLRPSITRKSYSRQTPQFGYIEGNGDIIFRLTPHRTQSAVVSVDTATSGVDVWAGAVEIGHRLEAGRHRLQARAGQTTIIVKKGGRTLYREQVHLSAHRVFPIRIGAGKAKPQYREAFSLLTIASRKVENYANSIAHDLDHDGREEIVTASGKSLYAFKPSGAVIWEKKFSAPITLNLIDAWNSQPAIGLTALDENKVHLMLANHRGDIIWQHVREITRHHRGKPDGGGRIAELADIDGDGRKEVIALATAQYGSKPRGLIVYDQEAAELWRHAIGPSPQNIVIWPKDRGGPDIIIGTYSPGNGNYEAHNQTSDMQTYVISIDGSGRTNWILRVGDFYNGVGVLLADPAGSGRPSLYAHRYTASFFRQDAGAIYRISRSGKILNQFNAGNSILSVTASQPARDRAGFLYAADNQGNLYKLDAGLKLLQKKALQAGSPAPEIRLVGVHDYAGDGSAGLLFYSFNRLLKNNNPLEPMDPSRNGFCSNLKFQIISQDFSQLQKSVSIAREWRNWRGYAVKAFERPETAYYPFMALSDKIMVYNY
jgi:uncharacterized caspase-like protein